MLRTTTKSERTSKTSKKYITNSFQITPDPSITQLDSSESKEKKNR
jgi:hypothetical protein